MTTANSEFYAHFMTTANSEFYVLAKGVLRYLKGVKSRKIVWCASRVKFPFVPGEIYDYSDATWGDVVSPRKDSLIYFSDLLQQHSVQLEIFFVLCSCYVLCRI
jgi:hypothetical protein